MSKLKNLCQVDHKCRVNIKGFYLVFSDEIAENIKKYAKRRGSVLSQLSTEINECVIGLKDLYFKVSKT